jgi:hypothetical protein
MKKFNKSLPTFIYKLDVSNVSKQRAEALEKKVKEQYENYFGNDANFILYLTGDYQNSKFDMYQPVD